jgi:hypothetical protein
MKRTASTGTVFAQRRVCTQYLHAVSANLQARPPGDRTHGIGVLARQPVQCTVQIGAEQPERQPAQPSRPWTRT